MKLLETIPFKCSKWDDAAIPDRLRHATVEVRENEQGLLNLHFRVDGESAMVIINACPEHYREQIDFLWMGLEQGYDLATCDL